MNEKIMQLTAIRWAIWDFPELLDNGLNTEWLWSHAPLWDGDPYNEIVTTESFDRSEA